MREKARVVTKIDSETTDSQCQRVAPEYKMTAMILEAK